MKAAVYYENGPPQVLRYEDVPDPQCHPKGIVMRVEAVAIEGGDTLNRFGGPLMTHPHVVGYQAAGEVIEVGSRGHQPQGRRQGLHHRRLGQPRRIARRLGQDRVEGAERPVDQAKPSVIPVTFGTADDCLFEFGRLKAGEVALIQAGASGVGVAAIQLAAKAGATMVIATASSDERLEKLKALGMTHGINYKTHDVVEEVMRITNKKGADVVVDSVGGATVLQGSILSLAYRGRVSSVGQAGRDRQKMDLSHPDGRQSHDLRRLPGRRDQHRPRAEEHHQPDRPRGQGRAEGADRPRVPAVGGRRRARLHREPGRLWGACC